MPLDSEIGPVKLYSPSAPGRPWRVAWTPPGMPRQVKDRMTKAKAEKLAKDIKSRLKRGEIGKVHRATTEEQQLLEICRKLRDPKAILEEALKRQENFTRVTVAACCDRYIEEYRDRGSAMTRNDATSKAGIIRETLGERYLDSLSERDIEEWRDTKLKGSKRYRNNILAHLRHLFERARVWGYVPKGHNPAREVPSLKIPRAEPVVWESKTLKACLKWYQNSGRPDVGGKIVFLALGAFAGMRPSEIEGVVGERDGLQWEDIDFKQRHIRIRAEVAGKLAEPRYIAFTEKPGAGLSKELADMMWATLCSWIEPYVYVLRSKSENAFIAENRKVIHKIGITKGSVKKRVANAAKDPTYLLAEVEIVETYKVSNLGLNKLEKLLHKFFDAARLDLQLKDRFGFDVEPREWFLVPLPVIEEAIQKLIDGTLPNFRYEPDEAKIVPSQ